VGEETESERDRQTDRPRFDVASLLHEGTHGEPETVEDGEVVGERRAVAVVDDVPLERTEPADEEQHHADAEVNRSRSGSRSSGGQAT